MNPALQFLVLLAFVCRAPSRRRPQRASACSPFPVNLIAEPRLVFGLRASPRESTEHTSGWLWFRFLNAADETQGHVPNGHGETALLLNERTAGVQRLHGRRVVTRNPEGDRTPDRTLDVAELDDRVIAEID